MKTNKGFATILTIVILEILPLGFVNANTESEIVSPVCEFHGLISNTLDGEMNPTTNSDEVKGLSIKITDARELIRGDVEKYPNTDCSEKLENEEVKRLIGDFYTSTGVKKYSKENFKVNNRVSGNIQLFDSKMFNLSFYDSPAISSIQDGQFYTISQLNTLFWAQDKPVSFTTEGYFMGIGESELMGQEWMEIHYSAGFTEIPIDIKKLEEFERKIEGYPPYIREEKVFLYRHDTNINIPSRYDTEYFNISEDEVEKIRADLKQGELYELTITHDGGYSGNGFTLKSYKLKNKETGDSVDSRVKIDDNNKKESESNEETNKNDESIIQPSPDNEDVQPEIETKKNIFSRIWNFIKSIFN